LKFAKQLVAGIQQVGREVDKNLPRVPRSVVINAPLHVDMNHSPCSTPLERKKESLLTVDSCREQLKMTIAFGRYDE